MTRKTPRRYMCPTCGENLEHCAYGDPSHPHPLVRLCSAADCNRSPARGNYCSEAHSLESTRRRMGVVLPSDKDLGQGGEWLRRERISHGFSRSAMAQLLGIHPSTLFWAELTNESPLPASWVQKVTGLSPPAVHPLGNGQFPPLQSDDARGTANAAAPDPAFVRPATLPASPGDAQPSPGSIPQETAGGEKPSPTKILSLVVEESGAAPACTIAKMTQAEQILTTLRCNTAFLQGVRKSHVFVALLEKLDRLAELPGAQDPRTPFVEMVERVARGRMRIAELKRLIDPSAPEGSQPKRALREWKERLAKDKEALFERYLGPALEVLRIEVVAQKPPTPDPFTV